MICCLFLVFCSEFLLYVVIFIRFVHDVVVCLMLGDLVIFVAIAFFICFFSVAEGSRQIPLNTLVCVSTKCNSIYLHQYNYGFFPKKKYLILNYK